MKKLAGIGLTLIVCFTASSAFSLSYEIDVGQDGTFETGLSINLNPCISQSVSIDIYLYGYTCPPNDYLYSMQTYITLDESCVTVNSCYPFDTNHGGPADPTLSECTRQTTGVYLMIARNLGFWEIYEKEKLGTIDIVSSDICFYDLVVADNQTIYGFPAFNDGFLADCNMISQHPTDGILSIFQEPLPCGMEIYPDPATIQSQETIQFSSYQPACCLPTNYGEWSDTCNYGNVDQEGLFTADATCVSEICEVCVTDTANTGAGDCAEVEIVPLIPCYADCNGDKKVNLSDLVIMKGEFSRDDCDMNPCDADCNGDNQVNLGDLVIMKTQFLRSDCPECEYERCMEECGSQLDLCLLGCQEWPPESQYICNDNCVFDYYYNCIPACP